MGIFMSGIKFPHKRLHVHTLSAHRCSGEQKLQKHLRNGSAYRKPKVCNVWSNWLFLSFWSGCTQKGPELFACNTNTASKVLPRLVTWRGWRWSTLSWSSSLCVLYIQAFYFGISCRNRIIIKKKTWLKQLHTHTHKTIYIYIYINFRRNEICIYI